MSSFEYIDQILNAQENAPYLLLTWDVVDSKKISNRNLVNIKIKQIIDALINAIKIIEENSNQIILVRESDDFDNLDDYKYPLLFFDSFAIKIYRDTLEETEIINIFNNIIEELNIDFKFHYASAYYETENWIEGDKLAYWGYVFDILTNLHKNDSYKVKELLKK